MKFFGKKDENGKYKDRVVEGIIVSIDFGYGMKYKDENTLYLKMEIQQFDGYLCVQLFRQDKIPVILKQFKKDYTNSISLKSLLHHKVYLLASESTQAVPDAIAKMPPHEFKEYKWIYNDNWN